MANENKADRKRRLAKERKQRERAGKAGHRSDVGSKEFRLEFYGGTIEAIERLKAYEGHGNSELLSLLIHTADEKVKRDPSRFKELTQFSGYAKPIRTEDVFMTLADKGSK